METPLSELVKSSEKYSAKGRWLWMLVALVCAGFASYIAYYALIKMGRGFRGEELLPILGALVVGGFALWQLVGRHVHPLQAALTNPNVEVVWIYIQQGRDTLYGRTDQICVGLSDGQLIGCSAPDPETLFRRTAAAYPQATAGFSSENEVAFRRNPRSLRRSAA